MKLQSWELALQRGGEMGKLVRQRDWSATELGPMTSWPEQLRTMLAVVLATPSPTMLVWGPSFTFFYNDAALPLLGEKHPQHALGQPLRRVYAEVWQELRPIHEDVWRTGETRVLRDARFLIRAAVPQPEAHVDVSCVAIPDPLSGETSGILLSIALANASERVAREHAEAANKLKDDFLATVSHELRTPLTAILGWAHMLAAGHLDLGAQLKAASTIERNARAQIRLIEDILDSSRILAGKLSLELRPLDLTAVVEAALDAVRPTAEAKRIALSVALDPLAACISGDPDRLQQVVWNLVNNAIKFTPDGGGVTIRLRRTGQSAELSVVDSGQGISKELLPHVFERFRQADGASTRRHGGLGLGLPLVRHLVEAHGGTVRAESEGPGRGAALVVTFPVLEPLAPTIPLAMPARAEKSAPRAARLRGITALVVDDDEDARELLAIVLRSSGAQVATAASAEQALAFLEQSPPMVLLSDVGMPGTDGYELMRRARAHAGTLGAHIPAIALSGYSRQEDIARAREAGFQTHLAKPVEPEQLVRTVESLVRAAERLPSAHERTMTSSRLEIVAKFEKLLETEGIPAALRLLNSRVPHRFTGVYRFDPPMLRNLHLVDAHSPLLAHGTDAPLMETYCSIVGQDERAFTTEDTRHDDRLASHPAREAVVSYCGVLLRDETGRPFGTLCHFDLLRCAVPVLEMPLMEAAAPTVMRALRKALGPLPA